MRGQSSRTSGHQAVRDVTKKLGGLDLESSDGNGDNGNGNGGAKPVGRGGMRGKRGFEFKDEEILVTKPSHVNSKNGLKGNQVKLQANYFSLSSKNDDAKWTIYHYHVTFSEEIDATLVKKAWLRQHKKDLGGNYLFDGSSHNSCRADKNGQDLPDGQDLELKSEKNDEAKTSVFVRIRLVRELSKGHVMNLQILNILMRRCLSALNLQLVGRNYFDPEARVQIREHRMELWPGYVTSMRQHENQILMCAEITHKVLRTDTAHTLLRDCVNSGRGWQNPFKSAILGAVVLTDYNNKTYRVDDVDFTKSPSSTFEGKVEVAPGRKEKRPMTFIEYYRRKYDITIRGSNQPLLVSRPKQRDIRGGRPEMILLIPELCRFTGLTDDMRSDYRLMGAMATHTRVYPETRIDRLLAFNRRLHGVEAIRDELRAWNMQLAENLVELDGREFDEEKIIVGDKKQYMAGPEANWTTVFRSAPMLRNKIFSRFVVVVPKALERYTNEFLSKLRQAAEGMSFPIPQAEIVAIDNDYPGTYTSAIDQVYSSGMPSLIMFIVKDNRGDRYAAIKKKCCVDRPMPSQVVVKKTFDSKNVLSICTKIAIQLNCKLGGAPWTVSIPCKSLMIVGYDVCHDKSRNSRSVGAFVASLDKEMSKWYSNVDFHEYGEEISNYVRRNMAFALTKYYAINNKCLPDRIVVFRDGVGEGQIPHVHSFEVNEIKTALNAIYNGNSWKLGYIIVTKRLNTRLFKKGGNPRAGTVVDSVITSPEKYDFFLVSQSVRQGTVSPTAYNIIYDNLGWDTDIIQKLSYKMTHLYYNWSGTVRVPAPCQYAHKLASLVAQSVRQAPSGDLDSQLYFL